MARVTSYSQLLPFVLPEVPGCSPDIATFMLKRVGRRFCERTEAFRDDLGPLGIVDYRQDYVLVHPYDASIHRILAVKVNSIEQPPDRYSLRLETTLRFRSNAIPHDQSDRLLTCGTVGTKTLATWNAITDGAFNIGIGGGDYAVEDLDFSGCSTMDDVASVIQTGLRSELASNCGFCRYNDATEGAERFQLWLENSGSMDYLSAASSGTDISGAGHMNGLTGAGTLSALLEVKVVWRPEISTDTLPDWFLDRYSIPIAAGCISELCAQVGQPWGNQAKAVKYMAEYEQGVNDAIYDIRQEFKDDDIRVGA